MISNRPSTESVSFFVPIGIGVLVLMGCASLVTAVTAFGYPLSSQQLPDEPPEIPGVDGSVEPGNSEKPPLSGVGGETNPSVPPGSEPGANDNPSQNAATKGQGNPDEAPEAPTLPTDHAQPGSDPLADVPAVTQRKPLDDVRTRSRVLPLAGEGVPDKIALCQILVNDVTDVTLELTGSEFSKPRPLTLQLELQPKDTQSCTWSVSQVSASAFAPVQLIGEFVLKDQQFSFHWKASADKGKLPFCRLRISADADTEVCDLWSPVRAAALKVSFSNRVQKLPAFLPPGVALPPAESLRVELSFEGWPEHKRAGDFLALNETLEIVFPDKASNRELLKILLTLKLDRGQLAVQASHFTSTPRPPTGNVKGSMDIEFEEKKPASHADQEKLAKTAEKQSGKYQRELNDLSATQGQVQNSLRNLEAQMAGGFTQAQQAQQTFLRNRVDELQEQITINEELSDVFSAAKTAIEELAELCEEIEGSGHIHFELIRSSDGPNSEVVISSSVNADAADPVDDNP